MYIMETLLRKADEVDLALVESAVTLSGGETFCKIIAKLETVKDAV